MKTFRHLMVDIETFGSASNSAIVSIGAVQFDIETGETGKEFYQNVSLKSCLELGLIVNADTVMWWMKQDDAARKALTGSATIDIELALGLLADFINFQCGGKECEIWGNSARFDLGILSDAFNKARLHIPWDFRKERCVRTLLSFSPQTKDNLKFDGVLHHPLDDCRFQIKYCSEIWKSLNLVKSKYQ